MSEQDSGPSCQRYAFWDEKAELVLVPTSNSSDDSRSDKDDDDNNNDNAWLVVSLANFTGRLIVRPKKNNNTNNVEPVKVQEVTPKRNNKERGKPAKLEAVYMNGNDQEVPSSPPRTKDDETMGSDVLENVSSSPSSLTIPVMQETRPVRHEGDKEEGVLPVIAEKPSHDDEDLTGEAQGEGRVFLEHNNLPG